MKLIWHSTAPHVGVGYGVLTRALVHRMIADGHEVKISTKHHLGGQIVVEGVEVFDGTEIGLVNEIARTEGYDYILSCMDHWTMPEAFVNWVAVNLLDVEFIHPQMIKALRGSQHQVALTEHGKRELERVGFNPFYAPLGVDTKLFRPDAELRRRFREKKGWPEDTFVIGLVGINYSTDRKNIIGVVRAFQGFHKRHPNSVLYLHTDIMGSGTKGLAMQWVVQSCGFYGNGGDGPVQWVNQKAYHLWDISQEELAGIYNAFDVMCLPSKGEGFGMPWLEAQACGCPVISADTTSGKQLNLTGWVIPVDEDDLKFSTHLSWFADVPPSKIDKVLEQAYQKWEQGKMPRLRNKTRRATLEWDWDVVYAKYWRPMLESLERNVGGVSEIPNYGTGLYPGFSGRLFLVDCGRVCDHPEECTDESFPQILGEWDGPRNTLARSYPVFPAEDFERSGKLLVDSRCPLHSCLSPRFKSECEGAWKALHSYPKIRDEITRLRAEGYCDRFELVPVEEIEPSFDRTYIDAMQTYYWTTFKITDEFLAMLPAGGKVLDVGTGNGERVRALREKGFEAVGTEINPGWVDNDVAVFGSVEDLPFEDKSFDLTMAVDVLEHVEDPRKAISELLRVSRGLVLIVITPTDDKMFWEDPTHKVLWSFAQWLREIMVFSNGKLLKILPGMGIVVQKVETDETSS